MGRPRSLPDRPATTERLMRAAERVFAERGFYAARLEDIAESVGVTRPSLLYHFGSKEALYGQVVRRAFAMLRAALESAVSTGGPFAELIDRLVTSFNDFLAAHPDLAAVLLRQIVDARAGADRGGRRQRRARIIARELLPLVDWIEDVLTDAGKGAIPVGLPVRAAILQVTTASLVRCTAGPVLAPVWGPNDHSLHLARRLFLGAP